MSAAASILIGGPLTDAWMQLDLVYHLIERFFLTIFKVGITAGLHAALTTRAIVVLARRLLVIVVVKIVVEL